MDINTNPQIVISRSSQYVNKFRSYKVFIDNKLAGRIKDGEQLTLELAPGQYSIYLKIDWCKSEKIMFNIEKKEITQFNCGSNKNSLLFLPSLFSKKQWVYLQKC